VLAHAIVFMLMTREEQFYRLISPVYFFLHLSRKAYAKYLENKIFLHAKNIRNANLKVCSLLEGSAAFIPGELFNDAIELINHYGIWMAQFDEWEKEHSPRLADLFVFYHLDDQSAFPKEAEQHFFDYYKKLKKELLYD
jgi:hypothetical protein